MEISKLARTKEQMTVSYQRSFNVNITMLYTILVLLVKIDYCIVIIFLHIDSAMVELAK